MLSVFSIPFFFSHIFPLLAFSFHYLFPIPLPFSVFPISSLPFSLPSPLLSFSSLSPLLSLPFLSSPFPSPSPASSSPFPLLSPRLDPYQPAHNEFLMKYRSCPPIGDRFKGELRGEPQAICPSARGVHWHYTWKVPEGGGVKWLSFMRKILSRVAT